jgi:ubiquinone/menaquinone biosynthesis C-methylase UbiE
MTAWLGLGILVVALVALYVFIDREIYFYEGAHFGARLQAWLYDKWAAGYDRDKRESQAKDPEMLARPLLDKLAGAPAAFVLDLATGTGRLPFALVREPGFAGSVIALDISQGMLTRAAHKLAGHRERVKLVRQRDFPLPFADETFDAVCCMEALEVMQEMQTRYRNCFASCAGEASC